MIPLNITLAYCKKDLELARQLLHWIFDLGGAKRHYCVLLADSAVAESDCLEMKSIAEKSFMGVGQMAVKTTAVWPANEMFLTGLKVSHQLFKSPMLWLEGDATPIMQGWANGLANEYENQPFRFMGSIIKQTGQAGLPASHLAGVAIYPSNAYEIYSKNPDLMTKMVAWDMAHAGDVTPKSHNTNLIHNFWGEQNLPPTFVEKRTADSPKNHVELSFIPKETILFHRCKDGSLINLLRKKNGMPSKLTPVQEPVNSTPAGTVLMPAAGPNVFAVL